jgi:hypothetical protein
MKIIVKSPCFIKGKILSPDKKGKPIEVSTLVGNTAIACGRATVAPEDSEITEPGSSDPDLSKNPAQPNIPDGDPKNSKKDS